MSRTYRITHQTAYVYGATMTDGYSVACVTPRDTQRQRVVETAIEVDPAASETETGVDLFGNRIHRFGLHEPHEAMTVSCRSEVTVEPLATPVDATDWSEVAAMCSTAVGDLAIDVGMFRSSSELVDVGAVRAALGSMIETVAPPGRGVVDVATALCRSIFESFEFDPHFTNVSTPLGDVLAARRGVCQDFAHVTLGCLRALGLAARYVSGYIETLPPPGQERLVGADASHAWVSVWTPRAGWVDFDPTNGHLPVNDHVTVAWGRDYADVIPVRGVMIGPATDQQLHVGVDVERV